MSSRPSLDKYYVDMLELVSSRSTCARRNVAAILVDSVGKLLSIGYNGVPRGMEHCIDRPCLGARDPSGDNTRCMAIHAEQNAIVHAGDRAINAAVLYCSVTPCFNCAKLLVSIGIQVVVCKNVYSDKMGIRLLTQAGVQVYNWNNVLGCRYPLEQRYIDDALSL